MSANIYFMGNSAIISGEEAPGLRERKRAARWEAIVNAARDLTEEHGLVGFTVEQLCERVGVSRRTFFNYFASKEDAVLGRDNDSVPTDLIEPFLERGSSVPGEISSTLLSDVVDLIVTMADRMTFTMKQYRQLTAIINNEPHLQAKLFGETDLRERQFAMLLARREDCEPEDPRIVMATLICSGAARQAMKIYFTEENTERLEDLLNRYINASQELIETSRPVIGGQP